MNPGGLNDTGIAATALQPDDVRLLTEITLLQNTLEVTREIERLEALRVAMAAEVDARAVSFDTLGFRSVKQWLARTHCWKCRPQHGSSRWAGC